MDSEVEDDYILEQVEVVYYKQLYSKISQTECIH